MGPKMDPPMGALNGFPHLSKWPRALLSESRSGRLSWDPLRARKSLSASLVGLGQESSSCFCPGLPPRQGHLSSDLHLPGHSSQPTFLLEILSWYFVSEDDRPWHVFSQEPPSKISVVIGYPSSQRFCPWLSMCSGTTFSGSLG